MQASTAPFSNVRITLLSKESTRALVMVKVADAIVLTGLRVVEGTKGLFVSMPSKKDIAGEYRDICFPASREVRDQMQRAILAVYHEEVAKAAASAPELEAVAA